MQVIGLIIYIQIIEYANMRSVSERFNFMSATPPHRQVSGHYNHTRSC